MVEESGKECASPRGATPLPGRESRETWDDVVVLISVKRADGYAGGAVWPQTVTLGAGAATIGRDEGCDVVIADSSLMSGTHACLYVEEDGRVQVEDLGSEHGTFIGGQPAHERRLARGERLVLDKSGRGVRLADVLLLVYVGTLKPAEWELQMPAQ